MIKFFNWYGGKYRMLAYIIPLLPDKITSFYEPFMGSGVVTLNKYRSKVEVLNDLDEDIVRLFKLMADKEKGKAMLERLLQVEYSEEEFVRAKRATKNKFCNIKDEMRKAELTFILITQSFNATRKNFRKNMSRRQYKDDLDYYLTLVHERLQGVCICNMDGVRLMEKIKGDESAFAFLDPPYCFELRGKGATNVYTSEMPIQQQICMLEMIRDAKCKIMLCGYRETNGRDLYDKYLIPYGWKHYKLMDVVKACQTVKKKDMAEEWIWCNYEMPYIAKYYINLKYED